MDNKEEIVSIRINGEILVIKDLKPRDNDNKEGHKNGI